MNATVDLTRGGGARFSARLLGSRMTCWSALRGLGTSALARATIIMPVIGYVLILNTSFLDWFGLAPAAGTAGSKPAGMNLLQTPAWRLVFIYYGLTLTGLATALFGLFCPRPQRKCADSLDYSREMAPLFEAPHNWTVLWNNLVNLATNRPRFFKWVCSDEVRTDVALRRLHIQSVSPLKEIEIQGTKQKGPLREVPQSADVMAALRTQFAWTNLEKAPVRLIIFMFYALGLLLVLASSLWGIAEVTATVFGEELIVSPFA